MFTGMSNHTLDTKGRIVLPAKFRSQLGESFYVARGYKKCIQVLTKEALDRLAEQTRDMPAKKAMAIQYHVISTADPVSPNAQGRIQLPLALREFAGLEKNVVVVGVDNRIEIWDEDRYLKMLNDSISDLEEALGEFRF